MSASWIAFIGVLLFISLLLSLRENAKSHDKMMFFCWLFFLIFGITEAGFWFLLSTFFCLYAIIRLCKGE